MENNTTQMNLSGSISVMDMINDFDSASSDEESFLKSIKVTNESDTPETIEKTVTNNAPEKKPWTPDGDAIKELGLDKPTGVVYKTEDIKFEKDVIELTNTVDDTIKEKSADSLSELDRISFYIEKAKKELGVKHCDIPDSFKADLITLAQDKNAYDRLLGKLKYIFDNFPDTVIERYGDSNEINETTENGDGEVKSVIYQGPADEKPTVVQINIDAENLDKFSIPDEFVETVSKQRHVILNLREEKDVSFKIVDDDSSVSLDSILSQYDRHIGEIPISLPASHYRCVLTGLSYPEILDLAYSYQIASYDNEMRKWSIVYRHIKNPSIGEFRAWTDSNDLPDEKGELPEHSAFEDFLRKTSWVDLEYMLYTLMCATSFDHETVTISCGKCKNKYEHVYRPAELLDMDTIRDDIINEMGMTSETQTEEEIIQHYKSSCLYQRRYIELPTSKFVVGIKHSSAADYMKNIFGIISKIEKADSIDTGAGDVYAAGLVPITSEILIPKSDGDGYTKVSKSENIFELLKKFDGLDLETMNELATDISKGYQFEYLIRNSKCPKCHTVSSLPIEDMSSMLFITARSLENVKVELTRS